MSAIFHPGTNRFHSGTDLGRPGCTYATGCNYMDFFKKGINKEEIEPMTTKVLEEA